ncbi:hypothetical protein ANCCEY_02552 [Ancylostoma ceylanicum]|uniref:Lipid-binding serum glycoprotein N-terminal domain-containing protein n=1 Tax=Ancylostoma ceylanicum TaxID=53326 RepID=A0A0D6MC55_9BILA|nr:hypothetical protein ANCCEY_02552 [Ancylostoma ceylanicum]
MYVGSNKKDSDGNERCEENKVDINEPITLTVSPKIWTLLETKANIINDAVTSITFPDFDGKKSLVKYRVWDGKVDHFSVPKSGVSFQDMNNGVQLSIKGAQIGASVKGRVEIGKKIFGKWIRLARMSGEMKAKSENVNLDVKLVWNDFTFIPTVNMDSSVRVDFTRHLKTLNFLRKEVQKMVTSKVNSEVPKKIVEAIEQQVNPRLQKLKEKLISMGYTQYDMEWAVQNNILRVAFKPKSGSGVVSPVVPIDHMLCVNANMVAVMDSFIQLRRKRGARKKPKQQIDIIPISHVALPKEALGINEDFPIKGTKGIDFTCVSPKFSCEGASCSVCSDIDINPASEGSGDKFHNCLPTLSRR